MACALEPGPTACTLQARLTAEVAAFTGGRLQDDATLMILAADQG